MSIISEVGIKGDYICQYHTDPVTSLGEIGEGRHVGISIQTKTGTKGPDKVGSTCNIGLCMNDLPGSGHTASLWYPQVQVVVHHYNC